jgi:hypothetical protein
MKTKSIILVVALVAMLMVPVSACVINDDHDASVCICLENPNLWPGVDYYVDIPLEPGKFGTEKFGRMYFILESRGAVAP